MKIIISGGTGFIGRQLTPSLLESGNEITIISRDREKIKRAFNELVNAITWDELDQLNPDDFDAVINLAGENIADKRWSTDRKNKLLSSRIKPTSRLIEWCKRATIKKPHLYNASAVGYYGLQNTMPTNGQGLAEDDTPTDSGKSIFSRSLVQQWEETALAGNTANIPVTVMRFGVVLKRNEGMLKKLELPATYGMGAVIGSGTQPLAWISCTDLVNAITFLLAHPEVIGPVNIVSPKLTSQKDFTKTLSKVLGKPAFLKLPAFLVKLMFGQMGEELLLAGQAVQPKRLQELNFHFQYPNLESVLMHQFHT